jgi:hypothetical protein
MPQRRRRVNMKQRAGVEIMFYSLEGNTTQAILTKRLAEGKD